MKVVINKCYGGFSLSKEGINRYATLKNVDPDSFYCRDLPREDSLLVQVVKELKEKANGRYAKLRIVEIPDNISWHIEEYDGIEWIAEDHRTWE